MHTFTLSRRRFAAGTAAFGLSTLLAPSAFAQAGGETRTVTTSLGTYDIPADPQRVICIDSRLDLEPAVALGLNVIGHAYDRPMPWVPSDSEWEFVGEVPNVELILSLDPDLIICTDIGDPDADMWPLGRLSAVAPVLPALFTDHWKDILARIGAWTGREGRAAALLSEYDALIAGLRERHAEAIASRKVVVVQPGGENLAYLQSSTAFLQVQVLNDLGAITAEPVLYPQNHIGAENFDAMFGDADGILYMLNAEGDARELDSNPLWQRLPAVAAGAVLKPVGNTNYGNVYTAIRIAHLLDELYGKLA